MVPVSRVPDLCLIALFRQMTLKDRMVARKVCRRWDSLVLEATINRRSMILLLGSASMDYFVDRMEMVLFCRRKSLKWLLKENGTAMFPVPSLTEWSSLKFDSLDRDLVREIATTFASTKELCVIIRNPSSPQADNLVHLFDLWQEQLTSLKLIEHEYELFEPDADQLYYSINDLSSLKHLTLDLLSLPYYDLPIVSKLEEFHFFARQSTADDFIRLLENYGEDNESLRKIVYESLSGPNDLKYFNSLSERLRNCFTCLNFLEIPIGNPKHLCARFHSLTSLYILPAGVNLCHLFTELATLHRLLHLYLTLNFHLIGVDQVDEDDIVILPQLKSVRALDLEITWMASHEELDRVKVHWTMPNLEVIRCEFPQHEFCHECRLDIEPNCRRKIFSSFKSQCEKLLLIKHNREDTFGTVEQILAE